MPLVAAVALPMTLPAPSLIVISAPASAVPAIGLPLVGSTLGARGALLSTVVTASELVPPAGFVETTRSTVLSGTGVVGRMA